MYVSNCNAMSKGPDYISSIIKVLVLLLTAFVSLSSRLFSVIRFESIIHEFDPWFNYRATRYLVDHGFYAFLNWFDETAWYPLGRVVGGTVFPGIMLTSAAIYHVLKELIRIPIDIRHICVFLAPVFSCFISLVSYGITKEISDSDTAALLSAIFMGIVPGYISRSVAGSYDNEAIAIFLLVACFYYWIKSLKRGSAFYAAISAFFYSYLVASWGGYVFVINMIPLHVFTLIIMGRFSNRLYISYSTFYVLGTMTSMLVPYIGTNPSRTSDHIAALGTFGLLQLVALAYFITTHITSSQFKQLVIISTVAMFGLGIGALILLSSIGIIAPWTGRVYHLWDTDYAKKHMPIVASVSEHQPTAWASFFFDLNLLMFAFPAGVFFCLKELSEGAVFVILYSAFASYFAGIMVRLMLVFTPIVCVSSSIAFGRIVDRYIRNNHTSKPISFELRASVIFTFFILFCFLMRHCTWVTSNAYSSPSVVLASYDRAGNQIIIDDFREAYYWLRKNTHKDTRIMSWWDYGYQIAGFSDRVTIVDNNTWNNTHIATVGKAMSTSESVSYEVLRLLDIDYVLVICGAVSGYSGDDINKFLWMVRIAEGVYPDDVQEGRYFSAQGQYRVDDAVSDTMKESLMYKMSYYRMNDIMGGKPRDNARGCSLPSKSPDLNVLEESFSSERFIVRIFKVKKPDHLGRNLFDVTRFDKIYR